MLYGPTIIDTNGIQIAKEVFSLWAKLFSLAPSEATLTGAYGWEGDEPETGGYEKIKFKRDSLVALLRKIVSLCDEVASDKDLCLFHMGI